MDRVDEATPRSHGHEGIGEPWKHRGNSASSGCGPGQKRKLPGQPAPGAARVPAGPAQCGADPNCGCSAPTVAAEGGALGAADAAKRPRHDAPRAALLPGRDDISGGGGGCGGTRSGGSGGGGKETSASERGGEKGGCEEGAAAPGGRGTQVSHGGGGARSTAGNKRVYCGSSTGGRGGGGRGNGVGRSPALPRSIQENREPYYWPPDGEWRKAPFDARPYQVLHDFLIRSSAAEEREVLRWKLTTRRPDGAGEEFRLNHRRALGDEGAAVKEASLAAQVRARNSLQLGVDVKEVDVWGMDAYTRKNVFDAVMEAGAFRHLRCAAPANADPGAGSSGGSGGSGGGGSDGGSGGGGSHGGSGGGGGSGGSGSADGGSDGAGMEAAPGLASSAPQAVRPGAGSIAQGSAAAAPGAQPGDGLPTGTAGVQGQAGRAGDSGRASPSASTPGGGPAGAGGGAAAGWTGEAAWPDQQVVTGNGEEEAVHRWIDAALMPAVNRQGTGGWDMLRATAALRSAAAASGDSGGEAAAQAVEARLRRAGYAYFRLHPKGRGILCTASAGLPAFRLVELYHGELHAGWRWFEIQDAIKKLTPNGLPDFYNIALERPRDDPEGYDVVFVDAAFRGSFVSRMSHSCTPNCSAVIVSAAGKLGVAMYTLRKIPEGEELTFDYASVTESEKEFRDAICLCGTRHCRGSYLYYAGSSAFTQVLNKRHNFLHRNALLLRACTQPLSEADTARLGAAGLRGSALGNGMRGNPLLPAWLRKWAALVLEFVELERELLPEELVSLPPPLTYTPEAARGQAHGVATSRVQDIVITLDKVKHCLRQQPPELRASAPLRLLSDAEVLDWLWAGHRSIAKRVVRAVAEAISNPETTHMLQQAADPSALAARTAARHPRLARLLALLASPVADVPAARQGLLSLEGALRELDVASGGGHTLMADVLALYASTQVWFTAERNYQGFSSPPVQLDEATLQLHKSAKPQAGEQPASSASANARAGAVRSRGGATAAGGRAARGRGGAGARGAGRGGGSGGAGAGAGGRAPEAVLCKRYGPWFMWGQLSGWYKQTVYDPTASLSAERRGTLSLPDVECCYGGQAQYTRKERAWLLEHIESQPDSLWKVNGIWSFKNDAKIYGSPMFDAHWLQLTQGLDPQLALQPLQQLVARMRAAPVPLAARLPAAPPATGGSLGRGRRGGGGGRASGKGLVFD